MKVKNKRQEKKTNPQASSPLGRSGKRLPPMVSIPFRFVFVVLSQSDSFF